MSITSITEQESWSTTEQKNVPTKTLHAMAVYDPNPESENGKFFAATPSAPLSLGCANLPALEGFEQGDEIYVTISIAKKKGA